MKKDNNIVNPSDVTSEQEANNDSTINPSEVESQQEESNNTPISTPDIPSQQEEDEVTKPIIPNDVLQAIPEEHRSKFTSVIEQTMVSGIMRRGNPIADKITTNHITQLIKKSDDYDQRERSERKSQRNYNLIILLISLGFLAFLIVFLKEDKELLYKVIIAIISFVGGFGIGKNSSQKQNN